MHACSYPSALANGRGRRSAIGRVSRCSLLLSMIAAVACGGETPTSIPAPGPTDPSTPTTETDATETDPTNSAESSKPASPASKPPKATPSTSVNLRWNALGQYVYSLDLKTPEGTWISPCLDVSILGSKTSATYKGVCTSAGGKAVSKPAAYRLYFSRATVQHWQDFVEVTPTSKSTDIVFELPTTAPSAVSLQWTAKSKTAEYSLDVFLVNGEKVRPCVNSAGIGANTSFVFDGNCTAGPSPRHVDLKDVTDFVICSTEHDDWSTAVCSGVPYTGFGTSRTIP